MENDTERKLKRLEWRVNLLVVLGILQSLLLCFIAFATVVEQLVPSTMTLILVLIVIGVAIYFLRNYIPGWFGAFSRFFFAQMLETKTDSIEKDTQP